MYTAGFPGLFQNEGYPLVELIINCMTKQCKGSFQAHPIHSKRRSSTGNKTTNPSLMNEIMSVSSSILSKAQYTNSQNNAVSFVDEERIAGQWQALLPHFLEFRQTDIRRCQYSLETLLHKGHQGGPEIKAHDRLKRGLKIDTPSCSFSKSEDQF